MGILSMYAKQVRTNNLVIENVMGYQEDDRLSYQENYFLKRVFDKMFGKLSPLQDQGYQNRV